MAAADRGAAAPLKPTTAVTRTKGAESARQPLSHRPRPSSTYDRLQQEPYCFDFFQAVRLLEIDIRRKGQLRRRSEEPIRFRVPQSLSFPPSAIQHLRTPKKSGEVYEMTVAFMGLTGPSGVLPRHYTQMLMDLRRYSREAERDALRDWLDMFNSRMIQLFYKAWAKYRFYVAFETSGFPNDNPDTFSTTIFSLLGLGLPALRNRLRVAWWESLRTNEEGEEVQVDQEFGPYGTEHVLSKVDDLALFRYGGLLALRHRPAVGLQAILSDYFQFPIEVRQFQGQWLKFDLIDQTQLGRLDGNSTLGVDVLVGERVWDRQSKVRIRVGPLDYYEFNELLPDPAPVYQRKAFFMLVHLVRLYLGPALDFDVQLVLKPDAVPYCRLTNSGLGAHLGWNTWLQCRPAEKVNEDVVLTGLERVWVDAPPSAAQDQA